MVQGLTTARVDQQQITLLPQGMQGCGYIPPGRRWPIPGVIAQKAAPLPLQGFMPKRLWVNPP
ncbi:hypothetical protein KIM372_16900 [Bombiscardovia nodaiensis]|uniref:Uncharacterized protein n=1 Tax=Bombiscardovia nodaiensis TaxID=2932181 RepID=A0ABN6SDU8_9BIFI|nr:hypothetical protein KIM372_16900 [Bombiscardovia nodaiensis]